MSRLNSRVTWAGLASAALAVALVFLSTMLAATPHVWTGNLMVTAYVLAAAATALGLCGGLGLRFPVLGERPARPSFPILPEAMSTTVSFVEVSPSTEIALKL